MPKRHYYQLPGEESTSRATFVVTFLIVFCIFGSLAVVLYISWIR